MELLVLVLLILAAVCFGLAAFSVVVSRINLVAFGLLCWVVTVIIGAVSTTS
jgi:hypothetical protein